MAATMSKTTINFGVLTDDQITLLEGVTWNLEGYPGDDRRMRVVYPELRQCSRWFSREWESIAWDFIKPSLEWKPYR